MRQVCLCCCGVGSARAHPDLVGRVRAGVTQAVAPVEVVDAPIDGEDLKDQWQAALIGVGEESPDEVPPMPRPWWSGWISIRSR